jgi:hypothetical protein
LGISEAVEFWLDVIANFFKKNSYSFDNIQPLPRIIHRTAKVCAGVNMKNIRLALRSLIVCGLALTLASVAQAQTQGAAKVVQIKGSARYAIGGGSWEPLKQGMTVKPGTVIQTGVENGSFVDLVLTESENAPVPAAFIGGIKHGGAGSGSGGGYKPTAEQNVIRLYANTLLGVDKLSSVQTGAELVTDTQLDLKAGKIFGSVKKMSAASKYEVKLPNGVAGIRGTTFEISSSGILTVLDGQVVLAVTGKDGNVTTKVISAGQSYDPGVDIISTIPQSEIVRMETTANGTTVTVTDGGAAVQLTPDTTIQFVSPTGGRSGAN